MWKGRKEGLSDSAAAAAAAVEIVIRVEGVRVILHP